MGFERRFTVYLSLTQGYKSAASSEYNVLVIRNEYFKHYFNSDTLFRKLKLL